MNYEKNLAKLNNQIECKKRELSDLMQKRRELKLAEINKDKKPGKRGKKPISEDILIEAIKLMETKTILDVCLRLGIGKSTLYKYGISRAVLEGRKPFLGGK